MQKGLNELKETAKSTGRKALASLKKNRKMLVFMALVCMVLYASLQMGTVICYAKTPAPAPAAVAPSVTNGLDSLKSLIIGVIATIGAIYLGKSVMEFASAYQNADSSGMNSAIKGIVGGGMMMAVDVIIGLFNA